MAKVLFRLYSNGDYAVLDADGAPIDDDDGDRGPRIVANHTRVRVPLMLMDSKPVMDARESAWLKMCDRLANAWRQPRDPLPPEMSDGGSAKSSQVKPSRPWNVADAKPARSDPATPPRAQVATTFETCPSCQYLSPSGPVKICQVCGYRASVLAAASPLAYARYSKQA